MGNEIRLLAVGQLKRGYLREAEADYAKRIGRFARVIVDEVKDEPAPERFSPMQRQAVMDAEGARLIARLSPAEAVVALCIEGKQHSSEEFAALIRRCREEKGRVTFVIGGSLGLSPDVLARADERLSISRMTFPHQLCRVMLLEQVYRAFSILGNTPYHK